MMAEPGSAAAADADAAAGDPPARIPVGISSCLLGEAVRYDGGHKLDRYVTEVLGRWFEYVAFWRSAFDRWSLLPISERQARVLELADRMTAERERLARLLSQEQGKPLAEATAEVDFTPAYLRHFAGLELPVEVLQDDAAGRAEVHRRPLGVVAGITPWNFPVLLAAMKMGPALVAGNTFILKPAPTTPLTSLVLGELCADLFPAGVVSVLADANDIGPVLTAHPDIAKVSFTGSTETGRRVMESAADSIKRLTLELGGCDPAIVLEDADVKSAAAGILGAALLCSGQVCIAPKRIYVHDAIYEDFCGEIAERARDVVVGPGLEEGTNMGPLQNAAQFEKVKDYLEDARENGKIIAGGSALDREGFFIEPTVVRDVSDGTRIVDEEQFGPIIPVVRFSDEADALARANRSSYGLGGSVWSKDTARAAALAGRLECGYAWVNQHAVFGPHLPHCGAKHSGMGVESSDTALLEYTQVQVVNVAR